MSVAAVLLGYGSTLLLAGVFGVADGNDRLPSTTAMAAVALATGALSVTGPVPPKKGEKGFARCEAARLTAELRPCDVTHRLAVLQTYGRRPPGSPGAGYLCRCACELSNECARTQVPLTLSLCSTCAWSGVHALRAYHSRASVNDMIPPAALAVRCSALIAVIASVTHALVPCRAFP